MSLLLGTYPSRFTGERVRLVCTEQPSANRATGPSVLQLAVLSDTGRLCPGTCGGCAHLKKGTCYVAGYIGPHMNNPKPFKFGRVSWWAEHVRSMAVGDIAALPDEGIALVRQLAKDVGGKLLGYTASVKAEPGLLADHMASAPNFASFLWVKRKYPEARTFRAIEYEAQDLLKGERLCSKLSGMTCSQCLSCTGGEGPDVALPGHGTGQWGRHDKAASTRWLQRQLDMGRQFAKVLV